MSLLYQVCMYIVISSIIIIMSSLRTSVVRTPKNVLQELLSVCKFTINFNSLHTYCIVGGPPNCHARPQVNHLPVFDDDNEVSVWKWK